MKKINTIFLLVITVSFSAGGIKIQAQDLINFNGWEFLSWKTDKENVEKILNEKKSEFAKTTALDACFKYQGMNTWLYYDNNNQLNKILQRNTFSIIEDKEAKNFFEEIKTKFIKAYGKPNHQKINKQDSVTTLIWQLKHTKIVLEYDYMYKIIDEFGAGSYWVEVNISPGKVDSDLVLIAKVEDVIPFAEDGYGFIKLSLEKTKKGNFADTEFIIDFCYFQDFNKSIPKDYLNSKEYKEEKKKSDKIYNLKIGEKYIFSFNKNSGKDKKAYIQDTNWKLDDFMKYINNEKENSEQLIIGKWELDYKSTKDFYGNIMTNNDEKENTLEFFENSKYKRFIWGFESGGTFQITGNEFRLDEKYRIGDKEGSERGKYVLQIEKFKKNKLIISFTECDVKVYQVYQKIKKLEMNNIIKIGTEFEKADDLLVKFGAEKNVFSRKFTKPSASYMLPNNVGIIIIYDKKEGKNIIVELLKCNNPEAEKDIREWKNVEQIELTEGNSFNQK
ncbi:MAG: hypothetical protein K8R54_03390 [Bacteroidales bacterium]|nr:hypothetical protein [Bacteroidales bacterium]